MILSGTIASTVQLQMLNNKWMQKKESGNVLSKQELNERSTWTSEQFMIADFQDQLEHNREAEKRQKIDNKIMSGGSLSPEEISYLEKNDPVALKKYRETKEEKESITNQIKGDGPIGMVTAVGECNGNVKGYVENSKLDLPLNEENGKLNVGKAVGKYGMLYIIKDLGIGKPYVGMTPIVSGEIAEDFTNYFATSEQTPSVIALGVLVDKNGVKEAGGYKLSLMPDATDEEVAEEEGSQYKTLSEALARIKELEKEVANSPTLTEDKNIEINIADEKEVGE